MSGIFDDILVRGSRRMPLIEYTPGTMENLKVNNRYGDVQYSRAVFQSLSPEVFPLAKNYEYHMPQVTWVTCVHFDCFMKLIFIPSEIYKKQLPRLPSFCGGSINLVNTTCTSNSYCNCYFKILTTT